MNINPKRIIELLTEIKNAQGDRRVLVIGDIILDQYIETQDLNRKDGGDYPIVRTTNVESAAGGAANVSTNASGMTAQVTLIGVVGADEAGNHVIELLRQARVNCEQVILHGRWATPKKVRLRVNEKKCFRIDTERDQIEPKEVEEALLKQIKFSIPKCEVVIVSDYNKGTITQVILDKICEGCDANNVPLIINPKPRHNNGLGTNALFCSNNTEPVYRVQKFFKKRLLNKYMLEFI